MPTHKIQYDASCRIQIGTKNAQITTYFYLDCEGDTLPKARENGLSRAKATAWPYLHQQAKKQYPGVEYQLEPPVRVS